MASARSPMDGTPMPSSSPMRLSGSCRVAAGVAFASALFAARFLPARAAGQGPAEQGAAEVIDA